MRSIYTYDGWHAVVREEAMDATNDCERFDMLFTFVFVKMPITSRMIGCWPARFVAGGGE